jgi:hypothetical protein
LKQVVIGTAELRAVEVDSPNRQSKAVATLTTTPGKRNVLINVAPDAPVESASLKDIQPIKGFKLGKANMIQGPYIQIQKGSGGKIGRLSAQEGMWEHKRGRKIDGGERRRAEVRAKRKIQENRTT